MGCVVTHRTVLHPNGGLLLLRYVLLRIRSQGIFFELSMELPRVGHHGLVLQSPYRR